MMEKNIKAGIKYCGGCNPRYDRSGTVNRIVADYQGKIDFEHVKESELYEAIIVICGCGSRCASYRNYKYKNEPLIMHCEHDELNIRKKLEEMLKLAD